MIRIAIVEDEEAERNRYAELFDRFQRETGTELKAEYYDNAISFLEWYKGKFDIVFMDIELPLLNGMEAAKKLRTVDPVVPLVFITNMAQYAIAGYSVRAIDYILKPVKYYDFFTMLSKLISFIEKNKGEELVLKNADEIRKVSSTDVYYLEVRGHSVTFHLKDESITVWGALKTYVEKLPRYFAYCNQCYYVNLKYVKKVKGNLLLIGDETLEISRGKKKEFLDRLSEYLGETP